MYWVDVILVFLIICRMFKGLALGLVLSIFNVVQIILSMVFTKRYYIYLYGYISSSNKLYSLFYNTVDLFIDKLFFSRINVNLDLASNFLVTEAVELVIRFFSIILTFVLITFIISLVLEFFSFLLKAPVLSQLNRLGGLLFGLLEGLLMVYLLNFILNPIASIFPNTFIGRGIIDSMILNYIRISKLL